jgi:hypothetical protein
MLSVKDLAVGRVSAARPGSLIAVQAGMGYGYGFAACAERNGTPTVPGVILVAPGKPPTFAWSNEYCLQLPGDPLLRWTGQLDVLANPRHSTPKVGHLAVVGESIYISCMAPYLSADKPMYWSLSDGRPHHIDGANAIFILDWRLGLRNDDGKFHELVGYMTSR